MLLENLRDERQSLARRECAYASGSTVRRDIVGGKSYWFRAISTFEKLTTLSLNYAYLATPTGDLLIGLAKKVGWQWQWLQLLCPEDEIPVMADSNERVRRSAMPDVAWRETRLWAPALKVQYVFVDIPEYDMHKWFFTEATPINTFASSTGTTLCSKQPWHLDCTIRTICKWYPKTLVHLYLQLWHHRERLDTRLKKLFPSLPRMKILEFVGEIQALGTLCATCCQIREKECSVNRVNVQLQKTIGVDHKSGSREKWEKSILNVFCAASERISFG